MSAGYVRQPRCGDRIDTAYGDALVLEVSDRGRRLLVECLASYSHRIEELERAETGCWRRVHRPCVLCGEGTFSNVHNFEGDGDWSPMCLPICPREELVR